MDPKLITVLIVLALAGCVSTSGGNFCQVAGAPIYATEADRAVISVQLAEGLNAYNEKGATLCNWQR